VRLIQVVFVFCNLFDSSMFKQTPFICLLCSEEELYKVTHVRLDREHIGSLDNLLLFSAKNVTNVYLQHVCISLVFTVTTDSGRCACIANYFSALKIKL